MRPKTPRSFAGADLSGEDLRDAHLAGADMTGAKLRRANLHGLDLRGARLRDADLDHADLRDAFLDGADLVGTSLAGASANGSSFTQSNLTLAHLRGADLRSTNFTQALLTDADLSRARLDRAILQDADLIGAEASGTSFRGAVLCGANLREAHLDGADFTRSRFAFTVFAASDLSRARGLEASIHDGPSTIGIDAFLLSRGEIPDRFLSGTGLSPLAVEYLKSVAAAEEGMLVGDSVFLLFADPDRPRARRLRAYLRLARRQAWYAQELASLGGTHNPDLKLRVRFHDRWIVLWSPAAESEPRLVEAISPLLAQEGRDRRELVFAVRLDDSAGAPPVPPGRVAADFRGVDWDDPRDSTFRRELERLVARLG